MRVFAPLRLVIVKVARAALAGGLIQPGSRLSTLAWVRSASIAKRLSCSLVGAILAPSRIGTGPLSAPLKSNPKRVRAASSKTACRRSSPSPSPRSLR